MYAKSVHDRLQQLLRYAGTRARPLPGTVAILAMLSIVSATVLFSIGEPSSTASESSEAEPGMRPMVEAVVPSAASKPASAPTAAHMEDSRYQALAEFLARKYKVSERVIFNLVGMAHNAGRQIGIDPLLIIAVIAVESRFNPIAESMAGAKGLMQVIPKYHTDKLKGYGGEDSVFDPQTNILVGSQILKEYIARTGSVNSALQMYAGALNDVEDLYTSKVMTEKQRLQQVMNRPGPRSATPKRPARDVDPEATPI
jgi:soluble lytic murein transglycosylase-like protein